MLERVEVAIALDRVGLGAEQIDHAKHPGHRGADLVAHRREEVTFGEGGGLSLVARHDQLFLDDDIFGLVAGDAEQAGEPPLAVEIGLRADAKVAFAAIRQQQADRGIGRLRRAPGAGNQPQRASSICRVDQGNDRGRRRMGADIKTAGDRQIARAV